MATPPTIPSDDPLIVRLLQSAASLDPLSVEELYNHPDPNDASLEDSVIRSGLADEHQIAEAYAQHYLLPFFDPPLDIHPPVDPKVALVLPESFCREHLIAPLSDDGQTIEVAIFSPDSLLLADDVRLTTGRQMRPLFTTQSVIERLLGVLYEAGSWTDPVSKSDDSVANQDESPQASNAAAPADAAPHEDRETNQQIAATINRIFAQAFQNRATDIHLEPYNNRCRLRMRVDGSLWETDAPPIELFRPIVSHLKTLSKIDTVDQGLPQEGWISLCCGRQDIKVRVNICPTVGGEKIIMRLLTVGVSPHPLSALGLDPIQFRDINDALRNPHGLMLITGPSGSGKGTLLYSCINELNSRETNLCTVEESVSWQIDGVNQIQTRPQIGLTSGNAIASLLGHDPDVIVVDQIRDHQTAELCVDAAMTGKLVLSTLPTQDFWSSMVRLQSMGVAPGPLAATLRVVINQRLVRRLCKQCKTPVPVDPQWASRHGVDRERTVYQAPGCQDCRQTGYRGRSVIREVTRIDAALAEMISSGEPIQRIKQTITENDAKSLQQNAIEKVLAGKTSIEEAIRVGGVL